MINPLDFDGAETLFPAAKKAAAAIIQLREDAEAEGVPVIYVNDNYGEWRSDREKLIDEQLQKSDRAKSLAEDIRPTEQDLFVLKPQFSGFYATNLPVLLPQLGVSRLILTGVATDICVLFTAADAHMREYELWVPSDCVAAECQERGDWALQIMRNSMQADTAPARELKLEDWLKKGSANPPAKPSGTRRTDRPRSPQGLERKRPMSQVRA